MRGMKKVSFYGELLCKWQKASGILFLANRLYFHYPDGRRAAANSGAPACLIAFGEYDLKRLRESKIAGYLCDRWQAQ